MAYRFSPADRRMFETAQRILGGPSGDTLRSFLGDGVLGGQDWVFVDESLLRRAGFEELSFIEELSSAAVLGSLRKSLLGLGHPGLDLELKAGLHRLGRAMVDLESSALSSVTAHLPRTWGRCARAAWFRLCRDAECRASAASLREDMLSGGAS